jgi:hypothetical protein
MKQTAIALLFATFVSLSSLSAQGPIQDPFLRWMDRIVPLGPPFRYRYVLGDTTDLADAQDNMYLDEFIK